MIRTQTDKRYFSRFLLQVGLLLVFALISSDAFAQTCSNNFNIDGPGMVSTLIDQVQNILNNISRSIFNGIVNHAGFIQVGTVLLSIYIGIYGILFMLGMVQITLFDFAVRMIKIGAVLALTSPNSWNFFYDHVVYFFNCGTDEIISFMVSVATNTPFSNSGCEAAPFGALDTAVAYAVSARMAVTLIATAFTGPYGLLYVILLVMALGLFVRALLVALWVYIMSLVMRSLLFGIAPIFLSCLLFNRTRHLFDGWLNQVVNACLQPILLFTFFSFFVLLILGALDNILGVPVCWTQMTDKIRGTGFNMSIWRFMYQGDYFNGMYSWTGPESPYVNTMGASIFPIDIIDVLVLLILAELAGQYNRIVTVISGQLAGATMDLSNMKGALSDILGGEKGWGQKSEGGSGTGTGSGPLGTKPAVAQANRMKRMVTGRTTPGE